MPSRPHTRHMAPRSGQRMRPSIMRTQSDWPPPPWMSSPRFPLFGFISSILYMRILHPFTAQVQQKLYRGSNVGYLGVASSASPVDSVRWQRHTGKHWEYWSDLRCRAVRTTALLHYITTSLLHYCTTALLQCCTTAILHYCTTALLHYCNTALLHRYNAALLHYCNAALLY